MTSVLEIIEALDNHKFYKNPLDNPKSEKNEDMDMDQLYSNVFPSAPKEGEDVRDYL